MSLRLSPSRTVRLLLAVCGTLALVCAVIGVFLPVMPTTPFLLLSAFCYARSSQRMHRWLMSNRIFGAYIRDWQNTRSLSRRTKVTALGLLFISVGTSAYFFIPYRPGQVAAIVVACGIAGVILRIRTKT